MQDTQKPQTLARRFADIPPASGNPYAARRSAYYALVILTIVYSFNFIDRQLLAILQEQGVIAPTPPERRAALERLLADLY